MSCKEEGNRKYIIGYWMTEKKRRKFNWSEFENACEREGLILKYINIEGDLEVQGPFDIFLNKISDILSHAEDGDSKAIEIVCRIKEYIRKHPNIILIDPLENVLNLRDRYKTYKMIENGIIGEDNIFIPKFVEIVSLDMGENIEKLRQHDIKFPLVCKPLLAHGSSDSHKMTVIFNEKGLKDCQIPCVTQEIVNHNAILYKLFAVNEKFYLVERPSLKNFYPEDCNIMDTIFFSSHDISKSCSNSKWSIIDKKDVQLSIPPNHQMLEKIVRLMKDIFGLVLFGVDVVVENHTGKYAIIDVNVFPGYDGYPNFFDDLLSSIKEILRDTKSIKSRNFQKMKYNSDDLDSGFESDEKKKQLFH